MSAVNARLTPTTDSINTVRFSPDGGLLAVGSDDSYVRFYSVPLSSTSVPMGNSLRPDPAGAQGVNGIDFSSSSRYMVVATGSSFAGGEGSMWEVPTRSPFGGYAVAKYFPISTSFSPGDGPSPSARYLAARSCSARTERHRHPRVSVSGSRVVQ